MMDAKVGEADSKLGVFFDKVRGGWKIFVCTDSAFEFPTS
jgi:hypothetical protein